MGTSTVAVCNLSFQTAAALKNTLGASSAVTGISKVPVIPLILKRCT